MNKTWLTRLYEESGLALDQAEKAAEETKIRILRRQRPSSSVRGRALTECLVRDPLVSFNRIIGRGDVGLPFIDDETGRLSVIAIGNVLTDIGIDPVVAIAYAKVVVEAFEPADLYGPVWSALGCEGPVDLEELRCMDWSPLRVDLPQEKATHQGLSTLVTQARSRSIAGTETARVSSGAAPVGPRARAIDETIVDSPVTPGGTASTKRPNSRSGGPSPAASPGRRAPPAKPSRAKPSTGPKPKRKS